MGICEPEHELANGDEKSGDLPVLGNGLAVDRLGGGDDIELTRRNQIDQDKSNRPRETGFD